MGMPGVEQAIAWQYEMSRQLTFDCVAKLFSRPNWAILIQGRAKARIVQSDSIIAPSQRSKEFCNTILR
jgi:hypothetical protein